MGSLMQIVGVQADDFMKVFPLVEWHFNSFADRSRGEITVSDLVAQVLDKTRQCWIATDQGIHACALTRVEDGRIKTVDMTHCAGAGREEWQKELVAEILAWAKSIGADRFRTINRPGYSKMLQGFGLRETHRLMELDIGTR